MCIRDRCGGLCDRGAHKVYVFSIELPATVFAKQITMSNPAAALYTGVYIALATRAHYGAALFADSNLMCNQPPNQLTMMKACLGKLPPVKPLHIKRSW